MRHLLLLASAVLLSATLATLETGDPAAGAADFSARMNAALADAAPGTADLPALRTAGPSALVTAEAYRPSCFGQPATLVGTSGDDVLVGTPQDDVIVARGGDDVVRSRGGVDFVCGGAGDDRISGGPNPHGYRGLQLPPRGDRLSGDEGNDRIVDRRGGYRDLLLGGPGDDRLMSNGFAKSRILKGGPGADRLTGSSLFETMFGGRGPDTLTSTGHAPSVVGGPGTDVLTLEGTGDNVLWLKADGDQVRTRGEVSYIVLLWQDSPGPVEADLAVGTVRLVGAATGDVITIGAPASTTLLVYGTDGDDLMSGNDYDNHLRGLKASSLVARA